MVLREGVIIMGSTQRGRRDGTGPYKNSRARRELGGGGRRKLAGIKCPVRKK